jgi:hypothetical protein
MNLRRFIRSLVGTCLRPRFGSTLGRKNDAEQHPFVQAYLPGSADMSATNHAGAVPISVMARVINRLFPRMLMFVSSDSMEIT